MCSVTSFWSVYMMLHCSRSTKPEPVVTLEHAAGACVHARLSFQGLLSCLKHARQKKSEVRQRLW